MEQTYSKDYLSARNDLIETALSLSRLHMHPTLPEGVESVSEVSSAGSRNIGPVVVRLANETCLEVSVDLYDPHNVASVSGFTILGEEQNGKFFGVNFRDANQLVYFNTGQPEQLNMPGEFPAFTAVSEVIVSSIHDRSYVPENGFAIEHVREHLKDIIPPLQRRAA